MPPLNNQVKLDLLLLSLYGHNDRRKIYTNEKLVKETKVTESLTAQRVAKLKEANEKFGIKNVWSNDGRIIYKDNGDDKTKIRFD